MIQATVNKRVAGCTVTKVSEDPRCQQTCKCITYATNILIYLNSCTDTNKCSKLYLISPLFPHFSSACLVSLKVFLIPSPRDSHP